ncbi:unnamed protein product [Heligmosomoides polygyrus]|uniref:glutathione transferase n=1 Tax=Heligmosomoides polygyrus TaxID=6339 RepID=A0A183FRS0_HELPZ|nr:unnamed protein product [Heligmosomoides polygyrus]
MVHYKLIYFNGRGAAEIIRQLFVIAGKEYEDVRLTFEEWPKYKPEMPFGQVPVLEIDGQKLAQSLAIVRYLAREFGYAGKTPFEEALVDSIGDQYKDFVNEARPYFRVALGFQEGDEAALAKDVFLPAREKFLTFMTKFLNQSKSGYLVGDSLTWADLVLAEMAEVAKKVPTLYDGFPEAKAHSEKIRSIPALAKWLQTRPETKF